MTGMICRGIRWFWGLSYWCDLFVFVEWREGGFKTWWVAGNFLVIPFLVRLFCLRSTLLNSFKFLVIACRLDSSLALFISVSRVWELIVLSSSTIVYCTVWIHVCNDFLHNFEYQLSTSTPFLHFKSPVLLPCYLLLIVLLIIFKVLCTYIVP